MVLQGYGSRCRLAPRLCLVPGPRLALACHAKLERLDKLLSNLAYCSRAEAKQFVRRHAVTAAGAPVTVVSAKVDSTSVEIDGAPLERPDGLLVMLHKPCGYVCSHSLDEGPRVFDLLPERWLRRKPPLVCVGRLDKDTSGLLLLTTQAPIVHTLTSPKRKVGKVYEATLARPVPQEEQPAMVQRFASGQLWLNGEETACRPARLAFDSIVHTAATVELSEGRYHQVRRMFAACGNHVQALHRRSLDAWALGALPVGQHVLLPLP